jgi:hypothetical protein
LSSSSSSLAHGQDYTDNLEEYSNHLFGRVATAEIQAGVDERATSNHKKGTTFLTTISSSGGGGAAAGVGEAAGEGEDHRRERMLEKGTQRGLEVALARLDLGIHELNTTIMLFELM